MNIKRKVIYALIVTFLFSFIPIFSAEVSAADDVNIISDTNVSLQTIKDWAKSKGATDTFISLADLYYKYAKDHGNINPAVAYAQAAVETGYGKFGGVITEDYKNPCGMKTSKGGDNDDPNAHQRFNSWDEGVQAHLDHLALYAGASGYPKSNANTYDPRHFKEIFGRAKTVRGLTGTWATAGTYADSIMKLYNEILDKQDATQGGNKPSGVVDPIIYYLDSVKYYSNNRLQLAGWILSSSTIQKVDFYMDGVLKGSFTPNIQREDVYNAYPAYNQHVSGFNLVTDISNVQDGDKNIKLVVTSNDGKTTETSGTLTIARKSSFLVAVDSGHCNVSDGGAGATVNGVYYSETQLNLEIGLKLRERLEAYGYRTVITRENNNQIGSTLAESLKHRVDVANNANADLFLSIHQNTSNGTVAGTEGFYYSGNEKAKELVGEITKNVSAVLGNKDRGPKPDTDTYVGSLYVIRNTNMPSVLIECGFIDNANDATKLANATYQYKVADAIVQAVMKVYGKPEAYEPGEPDASSPVKEPEKPSTNTPGQGDSGADKPGQGNSGADKPGQGDSEADKPGQGDSEADKPEQGDSEADKPGQGDSGAEDKPGQGDSGADKPGQGDSGADKPAQGGDTFDNANILLFVLLLGASLSVSVKMKKAN